MKKRRYVFDMGVVCVVTISATLSATHNAKAISNAVALSAYAHDCDSSKRTPDIRVSACTALIQSNFIRGRQLAAFYILRGDAYSLKPDYALALDDYNKAIALMPDFPDTLDRRAIVYEKLNKPEEASAGFEAAGMAWIGHSDFGHASLAFENAVKDNPKSAVGLYGRGLCKIRSGDQAGGEQDKAAALALDASVAARFKE